MCIRGLVSIVITNFNYARYVGGAIDSARAQTYADIEILVVDDGSTDNSREIILARAGDDERVRYFFQKNCGQAAATNRGIMDARGEFVAFLDADDIWYPDKLARQLPLFEDPRVGVVYSGAKIIDLDGREYAVRETRLIDRNDDFLRHILLESFILFTSSVVRKECFLQAGLLNSQYRVCTDYDLWLRIAKFYRFAGTRDYLIGYRARPDSLSGDPVEMLRVAREITEIFYLQNASLLDAAFIRHERTLAYGSRVFLFSSKGHVGPALASLGQLLLVAPFSRYAARALAQLVRMLARRMMKVVGRETASA